jgi:fanconi-associated nuclease 1
MLERLIKHPKSTDFDDDQYGRSLKRQRLDVDNTSESGSAPQSPKFGPREIADSEAEIDNEEDQPPAIAYQTDLENALPPVKTDKEAIEEYEAFKALQNEDNRGIEGRLDERKWIKGKSSIYVDAFNLALETVLDEESHLFDEVEMAVFKEWHELSYEAQYL